MVKKKKQKNKQKNNALGLHLILISLTLALLYIGFTLLFAPSPSENEGNCLTIMRSTGKSMLPTIKEISYLQVDLCETNFYVGDIVVFKAFKRNGDKIHITHRIVEINNQAKVFIPQGDNNNATDGIFTSDKLIGRVVKIYNVSEVIYL